MTSALRVGDRAPDFTLRDQHGVDISLAATQEHAELVVVVFFPLLAAWGMLCFQSIFNFFVTSGSGQAALTPAQRAWADADGYFFPLLSDFWPHGAVSKDYGVFIDEGGFAGRATFLIDGEGIIRWTEVNPPGLGRDFTTYRAALAEAETRGWLKGLADKE